LTYLGFITEGKLAAIFIKPSLGVPNWAVIYIINTAPPVDDIIPGFEDLEIDIPTPEGHVKLGDVKRYVILWPKKYIKF
jgi:hypothetical protein